MTDGVPSPPVQPENDDEIARNTGTNLFVTGLSATLSEEDVRRMFEKYGDVHSCAIMKDPHSGDSRGFGFVEMVTPEQADAAREGLQGESVSGRTLSIERARRSRPRTPTPGRYFGPPKRGMFRYPCTYGRVLTRSEDDRRPPRRGGYGGGYRDDNYRSYDDRRSYGGGRRGDDYGRGLDRYASGRGDRGGYDDRYSRDDRYDRRDDRPRDRGGDSYYRDSGRWEGGAGAGAGAGAAAGADDRYSRR